MSQEKTRRRFFVSLLLLSLVLLWFLIEPLQGPLVMAAVLTGVCWPVQERLSKLLKGRRTISAGVIVFGVFLLLIGPIAGMSAFVIDEATSGAAFVSDTLRSEGFEGLLSKLPDQAQKLARDAIDTVKEHAGGDVRKTVESKLNEQAAKAAAAVGGALAATWQIIFDTTMMLVALYFLLTQGRELVTWLDEVLPLGPGQTRELLAEFRKTAYAIVVSTVVTAAAQAAVALIGYLIARVPHPIFFAAITFFGAFIPAVGAASFGLLAALILLVLGHPYMALFLAIWSVTAVGLVDNILKPVVLRGGMNNMSGAVVFFSLIGGIAAFGPIGLVLGPMIVAFFVALLRIYRRDLPDQQIEASKARAPSPLKEYPRDAGDQTRSEQPG